MKKCHLISIVFFLFLTVSLSAQSVTTLYASQDALIRRYGLFGDNTNHGDYEYINMHAWTNGGVFVAHRSLIEFDLTTLPTDSIYYATLKLYSDKYSTFYPYGHMYMNDFPENDIVIHRITEDWGENVVTWNKRPDITFEHEVYVPSTNSGFMDLEIDVTRIVRDMLDDPDNSHGFMVRLLTEFYYTRTVFASSDNVTEEFHPRLEIGHITTQIIESPLNEQFKIYPNPTSGVVTIVSLQNRNLDPFNLTVVSNTGEEIKSMENISEHRLSIDLAEFSKGLYYLNIYRNNLLIGTEKLIVQ